MDQSIQTLRHQVGFVLSRIVVPLWVLAGATFKLIERNPLTLPTQIRFHAIQAGIDLFVLLATLIFIEIVLASIMLTSRRLARPVAAFTLTVFCLVLLNEMRTGNFTSCGCLGKLPMKPWQMLAIDSMLLIGVIIGRPAIGAAPRPQPRWLGAAAMILVVGGFIASYGRVLPERKAPVELPDPAVASDTTTPSQPGETPPADPLQNPSPDPLPSYFATDNIESWVGKPWREAPLFKLMRKWPSNMDQGTRYVVFYSRTCDHCQQMFNTDLMGPIASSVVAVEIPASRTQLTAQDAWPMPQTQCELLSLPIGTLWLMTPPVAVTVQNGVITCATEGDHKKCLGLQ